MLKWLKKILGIRSPSEMLIFATKKGLEEAKPFEINILRTQNPFIINNILTINEIRKELGLKPIELVTPETVNRKLTNCKNCGAPLTGNKCEYCGTIYSIDETVYIDLKMPPIAFEEITTAPPLTADRYNI